MERKNNKRLSALVVFIFFFLWVEEFGAGNSLVLTFLAVVSDIKHGVRVSVLADQRGRHVSHL